MSILASRYTHSLVSSSDDDQPEASSSSAPFFAPPLIPSTSSASGRSELVPLGISKTVVSSLTRRGVNFSPRQDTRIFHADDPLLPENVPPRSIRSYRDDLPPSSSPFHSPSLRPYSSPAPSDTPSSLVRGILKSRYHEIRVAASVEEGTLNNKEEARLVVTGKRPKLVARDSFQLAMMQKAAADGLPRAEAKGKAKAGEEVPSSDDSAPPSDDAPVEGRIEGENSSDEEQEEMEEDGSLSTGSLVQIILDGAEDLLTLEEAYAHLTFRLRQRIPTDIDASELNVETLEDIRMAVQPIRDEAPAMVRAVQRDLHRLLGKVPNAEGTSSEGETTPFRALMPLRDNTPIDRSRFTPSPTPIPSKGKSPDKALKQGYTEAEVRYRREASGVGAAALRFLALSFHTSHLYSCFSEADLQAMLEQVLVIPRTPKLPTPNPKRTYYLAILLVAQMRVPAQVVQPVREKVVRSIESAIADSFGLGSSPAAGGPPSGKDGPTQIKKEGFHAVTNLVSAYPQVFFQHYAELLPGCLRALYHPSAIIRSKASSAAAAFASAKRFLFSDLQLRLAVSPHDATLRDTWTKLRATSQKSEFFVGSHLKSAYRIAGRPGPVYSTTGEKKTEWHALEKVFKDTVGSAAEVHWACATWAVLVTLMGSAYASSGLAGDIDHIMDRSLQISTNTVRPLLGRIAFAHATHAYLLAGSSLSLSPTGEVLQSFQPFSASSLLDPTEHLQTIQLPLSLAMAQANDPVNVSRVLIREGEQQSLTWQRAESRKKLNWLVTCGLSAAGIVYAYTGIALTHREPTAREVSAVSGLPSSDGIVPHESSIEEGQLDRLDKTWTKVVEPMLRSFAQMRGVDRLTVHGWLILNAMLAPARANPKTWSLDRLLAPRYLSGEAFALDRSKDGALEEFLRDLEEDSIRAGEIPSWGSTWVVRNLPAVLEMFEEHLLGMAGINDVASTKWIRDTNGNPILPAVLWKTWSDICKCLTEDLSTLPTTLRLITRFLVTMFNRDPESYAPVSRLDVAGSLGREEADSLRISLLSYLLDAAVSVLGKDALATVRFTEDDDPIDMAIRKTAYGADGNGNAAVAGSLLGQILCTSALNLPLSSANREHFKSLISKVLDSGCAGGADGKLLGDMTNHMPWIFQDAEEVQLDVWRLLAVKWTEHVSSSNTTAVASTTNHTGALLVSLLSCPFREKQVTSAWHQSASEEDLAAWKSLLDTTVMRFRAKKVGSNLGVLESLAGHLSDFLDQGPKTSSTTISLSCLAAATAYISFVPTEHYHASHYSINENFVPNEFLALVSDALLESYPSTETLAATPTASAVAISPAVGDVLDSLRGVFEALPGEFVMPVLAACKQAIAAWLADEARVVADDLSDKLDKLYVALLDALTLAITSSHLALTSETLASLIDIYAPRLSLARSPSVPLAFRTFWRHTFANAPRVAYTDDVDAFLRDVLAAVPGMISVPGINVDASWSDEESQARFPHAHSLAVPEALVDATEMDIDVPMPMPTAAYDADVSQSIEDRPAGAAEESMSVDESSLEGQDDVFGPAVKAPRKGKGRRKAKAVKRKRTATPSMPPRSDDDEVLEECVDVYQSPMPSEPPSRQRTPIASPVKRPMTATTSIEDARAARAGILQSAGKWLSRAASFGQLFSPAVRTNEGFPHVDHNDATHRAAVDGASQKARPSSVRRVESDAASSSSPSSASSLNKRQRRSDSVSSEAPRASKRLKRRSSRMRVVDLPPEAQNEEAEDDDELLLSPESARKRRREEEGAIATAQAVKVASASPAPERDAVDDSQLSAGRFDDAPESQQAGPSGQQDQVAAAATPHKRTAQHARMISMVRDAASVEALVDTMDWEGVMDVLQAAETLRTAAMRNMRDRAEEGRELKRARRP